MIKLFWPKTGKLFSTTPMINEIIELAMINAAIRTFINKNDPVFLSAAACNFESFIPNRPKIRASKIPPPTGKARLVNALTDSGLENNRGIAKIPAIPPITKPIMA